MIFTQTNPEKQGIFPFLCNIIDRQLSDEMPSIVAPVFFPSEEPAGWKWKIVFLWQINWIHGGIEWSAVDPWTSIKLSISRFKFCQKIFYYNIFSLESVKIGQSDAFWSRKGFNMGLGKGVCMITQKNDEQVWVTIFLYWPKFPIYNIIIWPKLWRNKFNKNIEND